MAFTSKGQLAKEFDLCPDTFRKFCLKIGLNTGRRKLLSPSEVRRIRQGFDDLFAKTAA